MSRTYSILPFIIGNVFIVALLCSCSVTRRVPDGRYLLTKNIVEEDKDVAKKDRIKSADVERFILPKPNRKFLGTNLYLQLYNAANPDTTRQNWGNRTLRRLGEAPVLLDSTLIYQSAQIIKDVSYNAGFYDTEVTFRVDTTKRKKAAVIYVIEQKEPYRIGEITYDFRDEFLRPIILEDTAKTLIRTGDLLNANMLRAERNRITEQLKNSGYYDFKINNIEFLADSTVGNHVVDLTLIFKQNLSGYTSQGQPIYENNSIYRINQIVVDPDYDPLRIVENRDMDTMSYRGLDILYPRGQKPKVRKKILRQAINLYPNYLYSSKEVNLAYSNIMRLGYYRSASIAFTPVEMPDSLVDNQVSYIGEGSDEVNIETTTEKYLSSKINCIPALRQSYKIELEGTTSSNFNAINATIGYQNRNLFRGVELFDASVRGGYEFIRAQNQKASFEIGGSISLSFPRFITPFNVDPYNKRVNPRTKVELSINSKDAPIIIVHYLA